MQDLLDTGDRKISELASGQEMTSNGTPPSPASSSQTKQQSSAPLDNGSSGAKGQAGRLKAWPILREGEGGAEVISAPVTCRQACIAGALHFQVGEY